MRVLLTSHGSTGDIFPLIGYGRALKARGHQVRYATASIYREAIEAAGLEFVQMPPDWSKELFVEFMRELNRLPLPLLQLRHIYKGALPMIGELVDRMEAEVRNSDVLVGSYFFPHYKTLAARNGVPFATFAFCHNLIPSDDIPPEGFYPPLLGKWPKPLRRGWNRLCWAVADRVVDWTVNTVCRRVFHEKGLGASRGFLSAPADLSLVAVSPGLMDWFQHDQRHQFVGYLRWQSPADAEIGAQLDAFCAGERVPVLTFGSVTFDDVHEVMNRFVRNWPAGKKIIIQSGWAGLSVEIGRPEMRIVGAMSHDQLFSYASVVIHHGGAGTTASVLHAGVPQIIIPHIADQFWWGAEVRRLGLGRTLGKRRWPERLAAVVRRIEQDQAVAQKAAEAAEVLAAEDGGNRAVDVLELFVATRGRSL